MSDEYLDGARNEINAWEHEGPSWLANVGSFVLAPAQWAAEALIPQGIQDAVAKAIEAFLLGISNFANHTVDFAGIKNSVTARVVYTNSPSDNTQFFISADEQARSCWNYHIGYAAVEGGGTGAAGLFGLAADIPALFTIVIRLIQEIGTCYGYDMTKPEEQEYVLHILRAGSSGDIKAKVEALIALKQIEEILIKVTWKKMAQELAAKRMGQMSLLAALREFAKSLGINLTKRKALQMVPVIGAIVGASFNATYTNDIGKAAYMSYRRRYIAEKLLQRPSNLISVATTTQEDGSEAFQPENFDGVLQDFFFNFASPLHNAVIYSKSMSISDQERIHFSRLGNGEFSMRASNGKFIMANLNNGGALEACADSVQDWEKFQLVKQGDGSLSIRSRATGKFVSADQNRECQLIAARDQPLEWERFQIFIV